MPTLDYQAAIKAGKTPQEIKKFVDSQNASGQRIDVINIHPSVAKKQGFLDTAGDISGKILGGLAGATGLDVAGESLGRLGLQLGHQMGKAAGLDTNQTLQAPKFKGKQLAGDIATLAGTGLNLVAPGEGLVKGALSVAGAGGILGAGTGLKRGDSVTSALGQGAAKGAIAGGTVGLLGLFGKGVGKALEKVPQGIYRQSAQLPRQLDTTPLLERGIVGDRKQLLSRAGEEIGRLSELQGASPQAKTSINLADVAGDPALQDTINRFRSIGQGNKVNSVLRRTLKTTDTFGQPTLSPKNINALKLLELKRTLDEITPPGGFTDTTTSVEAKTQNSIADAMRRLLRKKAPELGKLELQKQAPAVLLGAMQKQLNSKPSTGLGLGSILQRTVFTPAVGTRAAKLGYDTGQGLSKLQSNAVIEALKRLLRIGAISGVGRL